MGSSFLYLAFQSNSESSQTIRNIFSSKFSFAVNIIARCKGFSPFIVDPNKKSFFTPL